MACGRAAAGDVEVGVRIVRVRADIESASRDLEDTVAAGEVVLTRGADTYFIHNSRAAGDLVEAVASRIQSQRQGIGGGTSREDDRSPGLIERSGTAVTHDETRIIRGNRDGVARSDLHDAGVTGIVAKIEDRDADATAGTEVQCAGIHLQGAGEGVARGEGKGARAKLEKIPRTTDRGGIGDGIGAVVEGAGHTASDGDRIGDRHRGCSGDSGIGKEGECATSDRSGETEG